MQKKRRTYWLADVITREMRDRALLLNQKGYDVQFFSSLEGLLAELETRRAGILVISDEGEPVIIEKFMLAIMTIPEIQGARLIFCTTNKKQSGQRLAQLAAVGGFRDIIPTDLDERQWLQRFIFATAGKPLQYVQPAGQVALNNISAVALPARITWVSEAKIRIECRVKPTIGAALNLTGALADALGVNSISLTVKETQRSHLLYRFSDAIVAEWSVPVTNWERVQRLLQVEREQDPGPRCRVFIAVHNALLRSAVQQRFEDPRFEISTALQKQGIVDEPRFFSPHLIFIEDVLCLGEEEARFSQMLANTPEQSTIVILGKGEAVQALIKKHAHRKLLMLPRIPKNMSLSILARHIPQKDEHRHEADQGAVHFLAENPLSLAEVSFPARLHRVHPLAAQIAMPFQVSNFALLRLESPLLRKALGRNPYVKVTATYQDNHPDAPPFVHLADTYLADLDRSERKTLGAALAKLIGDALIDTDSQQSAAIGDKLRTPELGSVKAVIPPPPAPKAAVTSGQVVNLRSPAPTTPAGAVALAAHQMQHHQRPAPAGKQTATGEIIIEPPSSSRLDQRPITPIEVTEFKPAYVPIIEAAGEIGTEVMRGMRGAAKTVNQPEIKYFIKYVAIAAFTVAAIWGMVLVLAPHWNRSGSVYSDQLRKFAPNLPPPVTDRDQP